MAVEIQPLHWVYRGAAHGTQLGVHLHLEGFVLETLLLAIGGHLSTYHDLSTGIQGVRDEVRLAGHGPG